MTDACGADHSQPRRPSPPNTPEGAGGDLPWLTATQLNHWKSLMGLLSALPAALDAQLKQDSGINLFEYHILASLSAAPNGALPMTELALLARGSSSRLSHAVARLEDAGWVRRSACPGPGRRIEARLTTQGRHTIQTAAPGHVREARRLVVDALTPDQLCALGEAARAVVSTIDPVMAAALQDSEPG